MVPPASVDMSGGYLVGLSEPSPISLGWAKQSLHANARESTCSWLCACPLSWNMVLSHVCSLCLL